MAYVESFYLDAKLENDAPEQTEESKILDELLADRPLDDVTICRIVASQNAAIVEKPEPPSSDYCGFASDEMPPIYREQLRQIQKSKLEKEASLKTSKAEKEKSMYAYDIPNESVVSAKEFKSFHVSSAGLYIPGFSAPHSNEEVHKRDCYSLPKGNPVAATEHVFNLAGARKEPASHYVLLPHEEEQLAASHKKADFRSQVSYTASECTNESSTITAQLGPAWGAFGATSARLEPSQLKHPADKYKGLSAFRPVSHSIESEYAFPELN